ncbi:hypothetical protein P3T76_009931 [Phytophthora citrophthora]|uniref:DDE-1 domain-containing protein n=1 Tax=Phytophthora citrophthora TaxID=4793 RepID=A0AAD9GEZ0_9STRA|nr:hypothetical protein P3T76_009931 [Phytophthora citrophthora]
MIEQYEEGETSPQSCRKALERLLQRTAKQYGFSTQKSQETKLPCLDLIQLKQDFAIDSYSPSEIYNMDETAINFDMPPVRIWGVKGRSGSAKVQDLTKHCGRMTAVLTIRVDGLFFGKKLPILFILQGKLGGTIETKEIRSLPKGHFYTVQEAGWMDAAGWQFYNKNLLKYEIDGPAVLLVDNLESHVSEQGVRVAAEESCATVVPLPPKSTSGLSAPEKRLKAIKSTIKAWEEFSDELVIRSFQTAIPRVESMTV